MPKKEAQKKGWKTVARNLKIKKKTKLALIVLGLLLALLLLSQLIRFVKLIIRPYNASVSEKNYTWNGQFNLNFVIRSKPIPPQRDSIFVVSYNPTEKKVTIITIPDETYIDVPGGFGRWQVRSIYDLGQGFKKGGDKLLKESISDFLGIPINGFASENLLDSFRGSLFSGINLLPKLKTDLTLLELIRLKVSLLQVRFDRFKKIDLVEVLVLDRENLPDGTEVFVADPIRLDSLMSDLADSKISSEHISVAIFNATERPLLAQKAKRLITNLGGNVIITQNAPRKAQKSYVDSGSTGVEGEKSKTLDRLRQIFDLGCQEDPKCDKISIADLGLAASRAQIIVVLGQDF